MSVSRELPSGRAVLQEFLWLVVCLGAVVATALAERRTYTFNIAATPVTRLCKTHHVITVNGQFPGPTLHVRNGDTLIVKVHNHAKYNATIHWHGVRQMRTGWADGPEYITQCPIRPGGSYTHRFTISGQEGTLWWHAHSSWLRASVYGALIIYPKHGTSYPFVTPSLQTPILLGEWWNTDPIPVVNEATRTGGAPNVSAAFTINGQPGDLYNCSKQDTFRVSVKHGQTNLLRVINGAVNNELFFAVADHELTVVSVDALYTKPYKTDVLLLGPGQTTDVLLTCDKPPGKYYMAARSYSSGRGVSFDNTITTAILEYEGIGSSSSSPRLPNLPLSNDTAAVTRFVSGLRSLASEEFPVHVPQTVEEDLLFTVGLGLIDCPANRSCAGPNGKIFAASVNNISFVLPTSISMLQAHYYGINGVFTTDFPDNPPIKFNYTADNVPASLWSPVKDTRAKVLKYNTTVQIVFQGTSIVVAENHPMHLHGYDFYVVGAGFGNYDPQTDPQKFNLVDPPMRNTIGVPLNGWAAIRFVADNPGVWLMHCHLDAHITWGLATTLLVENGPDNWSSLEPPPGDLPKCY